MAFDLDIELEISRTGDVITISPARQASLKEALAYLRDTPPPAPLGPIERTLVRKTLWDNDAEAPQRTAAEAPQDFRWDGGSTGNKPGA